MTPTTQSTEKRFYKTSTWKKASQWFNGIAIAAGLLFVGYQGVQYGHGKYTESTYAQDKKYQKYQKVWENNEFSKLPFKERVETGVRDILSYAYTLEDVDLAEKFFQAQEGYIFVRRPEVQKELSHTRRSLREEMERQKSERDIPSE